MKYADFYLNQKLFEEDYYYSDAALNSAKNSSISTTYHKEKEYIGEIAYMSKSHHFCSIIGIYGLASIIQRPIMSIYPPTISQLISTLYHKLIEPRVKVYCEYISIMWTPASGRWNVNDPLPQTNHFVPVFKRENCDLEFNKDNKSEKHNDDDQIIEFDSNINEDDKFDGYITSSSSSLSSLSSLSLSSSYITDNEKNKPKKICKTNNRRRTKLDVIKV
jgi:hypothetical protein